MSDKQKKKHKKLIGFVEECIENYLDKNLYKIMRKILNLEGFIEKSKYDELDGNYQKKLENIKTLEGENNELKKKNQELQSELNKVDGLKQEVKELRKTKETQADNIKKLNDDLNQKNQQINDMKKEIDEAKNIKQKYKHYQDSYRRLEEVYQNYTKLEENIKSGLKGLFGEADTAEKFFAAALQKEHLDNFYDYLISVINRKQATSTDIDILCSVFDFCFDLINSSQQQALYERLETKIGGVFVDESMIKTPDSLQIGKIIKVEIEGYKYIKTDKIAKKSLVVISE